VVAPPPSKPAFAGAKTFDKAKQFDTTVLPSALHWLAGASFDGFRDALRGALPSGAWFEPDGADSVAAASGEPAAGELQVRCVRRKCVKRVARMAVKVEEYRKELADSGAWPFAANIGDALRASVIAPDAAGIRRAWECIRDSDAWTVVRLNNKFLRAAAQLKRVGPAGARRCAPDLKDGISETQFPNLHINVLFQAEGCAPIVAEIQVHHAQVLALAKSGHKLYEVTRAPSIDALAGRGGRVTIVHKTTKKKKKKKKHWFGKKVNAVVTPKQVSTRQALNTR
jgi:hypothetical protein